MTAPLGARSFAAVPFGTRSVASAAAAADAPPAKEETFQYQAEVRWPPGSTASLPQPDHHVAARTPIAHRQPGS